MISAKYLSILQDKGISLSELGLKEIALYKHSALEAIEELRASNTPILGGDMYRLINGRMEDTYKNWYCQRSDYNTYKEYMETSWKISEDFILGQKESSSTPNYYVLVV
jgi:hypothetical protein